MHQSRVIASSINGLTHFLRESEIAMILLYPLALLLTLAIWWFPVFVWKNNEKWRRRFGVVLFLVNVPLYSVMVLPAYYEQQPRLPGIAGDIARGAGLIFLVYGVLLTILHLFPKIKAGGPGYDPTCLLTIGVYRYVRHPQISGLFSISLGFAGWEQAIYHLYLNIAYFLIFFIHIAMEEHILLLPMFGEAYRRYRKICKAFFPFIF